MKKVLINVEERELRVAILEDDQLTELFIESLDDKSILNNIYRGRIEGVIPGLKAAFVNIGMERNAFLHFDDVRPDLLTGPTPKPAGKELPAGTEAAPVPEYHPSEEELAVIAEQTAVAPDEAIPAPEPEQPRKDGQEQSAIHDANEERRRRRRGRRGGRRRRKLHEDGQPEVSIVPLTEDVVESLTSEPPPLEIEDEDEDEQPPQLQEAPPRPSRPPDQRQKKKQKQHPSKRQPSHSGLPPIWVPPAVRGAPGTRAAANPFDVFSPYAQPPANRKRRGRKGGDLDYLFNSPSHAPATDTGKDSQEDFFGPVDREELNTFYYENEQGLPEDDVYEDDLVEDDVEAPAPGNERFPVRAQAQAHRRRQPSSGDGGKKRRRKRGRRNRTMRRKGPALFAARKKPDENEGAAGETGETKAPRKAAARSKTTKTGEAKTAKSATRKKTASSSDESKPPKTPRKSAAAATEVTKPSKAGATARKSAPGTKARKSAAETKKPAARKAKSGKSKSEDAGDASMGAGKEAPTAPSPAPSSQQLALDFEDVTAPASTAKDTAPPAAKRSRSSGRRGRRTPGQAVSPSSTAASDNVMEPGAATDTAPVSAETDAAVAAPPVIGEPSQEAAEAPAPRRPVPDSGRSRRTRDRRPPRGRRQEPSHHERRRLPSVSEALKKGDEVMVQVIKEEIGLKGARISTFVSIPGRYLVLLPYPNEEGGVSRKVESFQERKRLKRILQDISSDNVGFIIRTAGVERDENDIRGDVEYLTQEWKKVETRYERAHAPELVFDDHEILYRLARDVFDESISEILIDSSGEAEKLKEILKQLIPSLVDKVHLYAEPENIFHRHQVEKQIQKAARRKVWLKSGGYLIIDEAEALTAIDVNTGKFIGKGDQEKMILKTNLEAAKAIARELKLRDIGGLIVIDFIDMKDPRNRDQLLNEYRAHLKRDRSKTSVSQVSEFGLVEMTRKRVRQSLKKSLFMDCPYCQGAGVVLNEQQIWMHIKHEIIRVLEGAKPAPSLNIITNPKIRAYIDQNYRDVLHRLEQSYGNEIRVSMSDAFHVENYAIERVNSMGDRISLPVGVDSTEQAH